RQAVNSPTAQDGRAYPAVTQPSLSLAERQFPGAAHGEHVRAVGALHRPGIQILIQQSVGGIIGALRFGPRPGSAQLNTLRETAPQTGLERVGGNGAPRRVEANVRGPALGREKRLAAVPGSDEL